MSLCCLVIKQLNVTEFLTDDKEYQKILGTSYSARQPYALYTEAPSGDRIVTKDSSGYLFRAYFLDMGTTPKNQANRVSF